MKRLTHCMLLTIMLVGAGCRQMRAAGGFTEKLADLITGNTPRKAAVRMEDQYFPDERRAGINELVSRDFGKREPYVSRYRQIAQYDSDYLVRATAIRALNRARDAGSTPQFIKALDDESDLVRMEGAKALANVPDPNATATLLKLVQNSNENRDVRIAAADALKHYRSIEVARTLIAQLSGREFGVAWQSRKTLGKLTGKDFYYDEAAWLNLVAGPGNPLG